MPVYFGQNLILLDKLASGGMGEVFRARQTGTGGFQKTVAVKRILPQFAARPDFAEMFRHEMNLCAKLQHPNIVQVFSNGKEGGYLYLVMEFVNGKTVAELLMEARRREIRIPPEISCFVISEVAQGLAYAHTRKDEESGISLNIVHRDVSPQNIMLGFEGEIKILDFGIARAADRVEGTKTGDLKGKIPYAAPEYIEGHMLDHRADIFGLGVVFHEMLAQRPLFAADSTVQTLKNVVEMPIPSLIEEFPDVRFELEGIVMKSLERDPVERFQSAQEISRLIAVFTNKMYPNFTRTDFNRFVRGMFGDEKDPAMAELRDLYGFSKRVPADLVHSDTEIPPEDNEPHHGPIIFSTFPRILFLIPAFLFLVTLGLAVWYFKEGSVVDVKPTEIPGILSSLQPSAFEKDEKGRVLKWKDSSWLQNDATALNSASAPEVLANIANGFDAVHFDGKGEFLVSEGLGSTLSRIEALSVLFVAKSYVTTKETENAAYVWSAQHSDRSGDILRAGLAYGNRIRLKFDRNPGVVLYEDSKPVDTSNFSIYSTIFSASTVSLFYNGIQSISAKINVPINYSDIGTYSIGQAFDDSNPSNFFSGDIAEILIYSRAITNQERQTLEQYLGHKYRIKLK